VADAPVGLRCLEAPQCRRRSACGSPAAVDDFADESDERDDDTDAKSAAFYLLPFEVLVRVFNFVDIDNNWHLMAYRMKLSTAELVDIKYNWWNTYGLESIG
jgi:hypothetical protein